MKAPVQIVRVAPVHPGPNQPSRIEVHVLIGEQTSFNVGVLTVDQALTLGKDAIAAAMVVMRQTERQ